MDEQTNQVYSDIKIENGIQIIDINKEMSKYELLSLLFHQETILVDSNMTFSTVKIDKKRYFENTAVCFNCEGIGHISRDCKVVKDRNCMYCDIDHTGRTCDFLFCTNCKKLGHTVRFCYEKQNFHKDCTVCTLANHYEDECPLIWRKYKYKTISNKILRKSCPLCFSDQHFIDDCKLQNRKYTIFTLKYADLYLTKKNKFKKS